MKLNPLNTLLFCLAFSLPILHYNQCKFRIEEYKLEIDERREEVPVKSIFELELPGVPPMPDHLPEPKQEPATI